MTTATDGPLAIHVVIRTKPGERDDVLAMIRDAFRRIRTNEAACVELTGHVGDHPDEIMLYELWTDRATFEAFADRPEMIEYLKELDARVLGRQFSKWTRATI